MSIAEKILPLAIQLIKGCLRYGNIADLPEFDLSQQLKSEADIAAYITLVIEEGDAAELAHALAGC